MSTLTTMRILETVAFAARAHVLQKRKYTDEPYLMHLLSVANIVARHGHLPEEWVDIAAQAAILHDAIEDTPTTRAMIELKFGPVVAELVVELTDVYVAGYTDADGNKPNRDERKRFERMRMATISTLAQTVKLADLIDNTASISQHDPDFARTYLREKELLLEVLTKPHERIKEMAREALQHGQELLVQHALKPKKQQ